MAAEWRKLTLGEVCTKIGSGATPRGGNEAYRGGKTALIRSQNVHNNRFDSNGLVFIDDEQAAALRSVIVQEGDVLLNITGNSVARCCQVDSRVLPARVNQHVAIIRPNADKLDPRFLMYWLTAPRTQAHLLALASAGATRNALTKSMIENLAIYAPTIGEQRTIAHILGTLDDKIELNRRMNETLEAMARALFKSWFVDFDPVRAKAEGRTPSGMDAETAKLFPSEFVDSELGPIPKGWRLSTLGETSKLVMGQSPPGDTYNENGAGIPFFQGSTDFGFRFPSRRVFCTAPTRRADPGDTLVSVRAPVGTLNMAFEACAIGRGVAAVRHRSGSRSFTYYLLQSMQTAFAPYEGEGTVFGSINKAAFAGLRHVEPPPQTIGAFDNQAAPLDERISALTKESTTLACVRDELLPRLLSGELPVDAAERVVEEVA